MRIAMKFGGVALSTADDIQSRAELIRRYYMEKSTALTILKSFAPSTTATVEGRG